MSSEAEVKQSSQTYLLGGPDALADILAVLEPGQNLLNRGLLFPGLLLLKTLTALAGDLLLGLESLLDKLDILEAQLLADDVEITRRVHVTLDVDDLGIIEAADDLEDGIDGADVRQEGVAQTGTSRGTTGQAGDVVDSQVGRDLGLGLVLVAQPVEAVIGNDDARLLGLNGGVGKVLRRGPISVDARRRRATMRRERVNLRRDYQGCTW